MAEPTNNPQDNDRVWEKAMKAFDFDLSLINANQSAEVQRAAVNSVLDKFFLSHIVILPTPGEDQDETQKLFDDALNRLDKASTVLERFLRGKADPEAEEFLRFVFVSGDRSTLLSQAQRCTSGFSVFFAHQLRKEVRLWLNQRTIPRITTGSGRRL